MTQNVTITKKSVCFQLRICYIINQVLPFGFFYTSLMYYGSVLQTGFYHSVIKPLYGRRRVTDIFGKGEEPLANTDPSDGI